jgi:hypothetical protein
MRIADIINSRQFAEGQVLGFETVQHFQLKLTRVSTALTNKPSTAMMLICPDPSPDEAVSDVVLSREDLVSSLSRKVFPDHLPFEFDVERPHETSKVTSNSWGAVHFRGDSVVVQPASV